MYTLVKTIAVEHTLGAQWLEVDISNMQMADIFQRYRAAYITLSSSMLANNAYVNLDDLRITYAASMLTFNQMLTALGSNSLPTVSSIPTLSNKKAIWSDAFRAGYSIDIVKPGVPSDNPTINRVEKTWVKLSRNNTSSIELYQNCMVSVNGYWHMTDSNSQDFFIVDGSKSLFKSRQNAIGLWSFKALGGIRYIPITTSMLYRGDPDQALKTRMYINLNEDLSNKTVLMVLGGYLHFVDGDSLFQMTESRFGVNIGKLPLAQRYQESFPYLDFTELGLSTRPDNPSVVDMEDFYTDDKLIKYFTMSQSFFVVIDKPNVYHNRIQVRNEPLPGSFITYKEPKYPLIVGHGRVAEYWKTLDDGYWHMNVNDSYLQNKVFATLDYNEQILGMDSNETMIPYFHSPAYLLEVGTDF